MKDNQIVEAPLVKLAVCLMAGIIAGQYLMLSVPLLPVFTAVVAACLLLWRCPQWQSVMISVGVVVLGMLLMQWQKERLHVEWPGGMVAYEAVVVSDPVEKPRTMAVDLLLTGNGQRIKGYVAKDRRSSALHIGDGLKAMSVIQANREWRIGTFDYRRYLEIHGFTGSTYVSSRNWKKAQVSLARLSRLDRVRLSFLRQRSHLLERLRDGADDLDAYAVVAAMTLGDKSALTRDVKDVYSVTGGSHVLALSGLHLGIIYTLLSLLVVGRRWHAVSQLLLVVAIWAFVLLVGMPVSVVRSAVMLTVYALLSLGHRGRMSVNVLAFTAVILLMFSPLSLFDVGFQMSFMAVFSILLWMPLADRVFSEAYLQRHRVVRWGWSMIAVSFAAQMGVAPLVAYYFGRFSTYFLLTNFIVLPAASLILYLTPVVMLVPSLAYLLLYIAGWLNRILAWVASLPGASIDHLHPSVIQVTMAYVVIAALWLLMQRVGRVRRAA